MKVDYQNTIIYKLCCLDVNVTEIYVGSTTNFKLRNQHHRNCCNNPAQKRYNQYNYQFIRNHGGYENWRMIVINEFPCKSNREAECEEQRVMVELGATLNSKRAFRTEQEKQEQMKQLCEKRKTDPKYIEYQKQFEKKRKTDPKRIEYRKQCDKEYYKNNKDEINEKKKEKVTCEFCGKVITKAYLKKHQTIVKKCIKIQEELQTNI
jgi:hypothetical protein